MLSRRIDKFGVSSHIFAIIMRVWRITAACACGLPVHTFTCHQHRTTRSLWDDRNVVHIRYCLVVRVDRFALAFRSLPSIPYIYIHFICLNEDNKENEAHRRMTHRKHFSQSFWRGLRKQNAVSLSISPSFAYLLRCEAHFLMFGGLETQTDFHAVAALCAVCTALVNGSWHSTALAFCQCDQRQ